MAGYCAVLLPCVRRPFGQAPPPGPRREAQGPAGQPACFRGGRRAATTWRWFREGKAALPGNSWGGALGDMTCMPQRSLRCACWVCCAKQVVQTIDMNQDNYLAEALKMRNLLAEFKAPAACGTGAAGPAPASR